MQSPPRIAHRVIGLVALFSHALPAQQLGDSSPRFEVPIAIGSEAEDRARVQQLRGDASVSGWLIRVPSAHWTLIDRETRAAGITTGWRCSPRISPLAPSIDLAWNSDLPVERNDGALWAGRGANVAIDAGVRIACGRVRLQLAPELWYARNANFVVLPGGDPERSGFSSPWYVLGTSADVPLRFGNHPLVVLGPGESVLDVDLGRVVVGMSTESQWWGPGIRNALVMSNHAAGIPHFFLRTPEPVATPAGTVEARWIVGALTESPYFDRASENDLRSLSGLVVTLRPAFDSSLTVGAARVVYAPIPGIGALPARFLDAVARWGQGANVRLATSGRAADQLTSLFARMVLPRSGVEIHGEWARVILPPSFQTLLRAPQHTQGFTVGLQWVDIRSAATDPTWRIQTELTMLEQPLRDRSLDPLSFYVSPVVPQGYTQRGQVIGASIGPGASSQFIAVDRLANQWRIGAFAGRIRWAHDEYYRRPTGFSLFGEDVSILAGLRGSQDVGPVNLAAEVVSEHRLNYLFQNIHQGFDLDRTYDVRNTSLRLVVTPLSRP